MESLLDYLDDNIIVGSRAESWEDAVRLAGMLLVKRGVATEKYVEAMIHTVRELGPYSVIAPHVALPHARPEDGALKVGVSIVILANDVAFGSPNDPVRVVIAFASPDKSSHIRLLSEIAELLSIEGAVEKLMNAKTSEEVRSLISTLLSRCSREA